MSLKVRHLLACLAFIAIPACDAPPPPAGGGTDYSPKNLSPTKPPLGISSVPDVGKNGQMTEVLQFIKTGNIDEAINILQQQTDTRLRQEMLSAIQHDCMGEHFENLAKIIAASKNSNEKGVLLSSIAMSHAGKNPKLLFESASAQLTGDSRNMLQQASIRAALLIGDRVLMDVLFKQMPFSRQRTALVSEIAINDYRSEGISAFSRVSNFELLEDRIAGATALISTIEGSGNILDMESLVSFLEPISISGWQRAVTAVAHLQKKKLNDSDMLAWLGTLTGVRRDISMEYYIEQSSGPLLDRFNLAKTVKDASSRESLYFNIAVKAASQDPASAAKMILNLDATFRSAAIDGLVYKWFDHDSEALSDWINTLPKGSDRDKAIAATTRSLSGVDKVAAREAAAAIDDETLRASVLSSIR